ncbi:hypothetical protein OIU80_19550 [Flavobacterium sp. LS1R47]|jgi:hypothetical protein|uniref:Uncharacterized protein n=1 Tax=Flavobacterium frigoritolerans TaxID=2987686 RepID=A0A9X3CAB5_9FLAO|nr:hypothetical protein [Flavobacterium frigoritolerans]MCV9934481.1 hypothetical protein [Flavobacterium frigoritolerans]
MAQNLNLEVNAVSYMDFNNPAGQTTIQGIRGVSDSENVYITASLLGENNIVQGLIYEGKLIGNGSNGKWHVVNFPSTASEIVTNTSCYGPNNGPDGSIQIVGSYKISTTTGGVPSGNLGFYYEGPLDGSGTWIRISPNNGNTNNVFVHSIMGGIAVGNYDVENDKNGYAFLYDIATKEYTEFKLPDSITNTLYGIWYNGEDSYTLAGGYSSHKLGKLSQAFLVDYNGKTKKISNLKSFSYQNETALSIITHFEGITGSKDNGYNMPADWITLNGDSNGASFVSVSRNSDGSFGEANWIDIEFPGSSITSANTAYKNNILGIYVIKDDTDTKVVSSFVAKVVRDK